MELESTTRHESLECSRRGYNPEAVPWCVPAPSRQHKTLRRLALTNLELIVTPWRLANCVRSIYDRLISELVKESETSVFSSGS